MAFAELEDLEAFLGVDIASTDPVRGDALLEMASAIIKSYVGHNIVETTSTLTLNGPGTGVIVLPGIPVTAVGPVVVDGETQTYAVDDYSYEWSASGVLRRRWGSWGNAVQSIVVTYTYGYATVPADVKYVCCQLAARLYQNPQGLLQESIGGYSYSRGANAAAGMTLTDDEMSILDGYRAVLVG